MGEGRYIERVKMACDETGKGAGAGVSDPVRSKPTKKICCACPETKVRVHLTASIHEEPVVV